MSQGVRSTNNRQPLRGLGLMSERVQRTNKQSNKPKITVIGGGTGVSTVLSELKKVADVTAIVSTMDSGGSSGRLRDENQGWRLSLFRKDEKRTSPQASVEGRLEGIR